MQITTKDILIKARDLILEVGWTQKNTGRTKDGWGLSSQGLAVAYAAGNCGGVCAQGAIGLAIKLLVAPPYDISAHKYVIACYRQMASAGAPFGLVSWNDAQYRTREEVLGLFNRAIELAEGEKDGDDSGRVDRDETGS